MEDWSKIFYYDQTSPSCLRWVVKPSRRIGIGDVAGSLDKVDGYYRVGYNRQNYKCHRVVWELFRGEIGEHLQIDHTNGIRMDNSISNLRLVSPSQNSQNQKKDVRNKSGVTGVYLGARWGVWVAQWSNLNGKLKSKSFSINKYGYDLAFKLASEYRAKMMQELNSEGSDYTERHGT